MALRAGHHTIPVDCKGRFEEQNHRFVVLLFYMEFSHRQKGVPVFSFCRQIIYIGGKRIGPSTKPWETLDVASTSSVFAPPIITLYLTNLETLKCQQSFVRYYIKRFPKVIV